MVYLGAAAIFFAIIVMVYAIFGMIRNEWVYHQRIKLRDNDYSSYEKLADYNTMCNKFWIWNIRRFIQESNQ